MNEYERGWRDAIKAAEQVAGETTATDTAYQARQVVLHRIRALADSKRPIEPEGK